MALVISLGMVLRIGYELSLRFEKTSPKVEKALAKRRLSASINACGPNESLAFSFLKLRAYNL
jgi:hypothetical protein